MKYYAFDWDDNLLIMPTKIIVKDNLGNEVEMTTKDFSIWRNQIGKKPFLFNGKKIVSFAEKPFRYFREDGNVKFIEESLVAESGPAWKDFVECINNKNIFSIITARGHEPKVIKNCVKALILNRKDGLNFNDVFDEKNINEYLDKCKFYPVSFLEENASRQPEILKAEALEDFIKHVNKLYKNEGINNLLINDINNKFIPTFGFSDDDEKNIIFIKEYFINKKVLLNTYLTKEGNKILY